jgi:uncharacterized membrane protein YdbT with pleckstrin-like domain
MARIHWWIFVWPIVFIVGGFVLVGTSAPAGSSEPGPLGIVGTLLILFGLAKIISAAIYRFTTELAVTDRKVIGKWGLVRRNTIEQRLDKVDATIVQQSIFGRMLDFGNITVKGSGTTSTPIKMISHPIEFKKAVDVATSEFENRGRPS